MKRTLIIAMTIVALCTIFMSCSSDNFTCVFNGNIEFKNTGNTPSIPASELVNPVVTLYTETGEIVATTSDFTDDQYAITADITEGNYKIVATATYQKNGRNYSLYATTGMFFIAKGTSSFTYDLLCARP